MTVREQLAQFAAGSKPLGALCREYRSERAVVHLEELVGGAMGDQDCSKSKRNVKGNK